jgi:hypothetical protein
MGKCVTSGRTRSVHCDWSVDQVTTCLVKEYTVVWHSSDTKVHSKYGKLPRVEREICWENSTSGARLIWEEEECL